MVRFRRPELDVSERRQDARRSELALVVLSVVKQRLDAVRAVLAGVTVTEVASATGPRVGCLEAGEAYESAGPGRNVPLQAAGVSLLDLYKPHQSAELT